MTLINAIKNLRILKDECNTRLITYYKCGNYIDLQIYKLVIYTNI